MVLSKAQLSQIARARENYKCELLFIQKAPNEQEKVYQDYNLIKFQEFQEFEGDLLPIAQKVRDELWTQIDAWVESKTKTVLHQAIDDNDTLDLEDILFLSGIASIVNRVVAGEYSTEDLNKRIASIYDNSAAYYTNKEFESLLRFLEDKGFKVTRTGDEVSILPPKNYPVNTAVRVTPPIHSTFSFSNPEIMKYYKDYTLPAITSLGEKYAPELKKEILRGYENGLTVNEIAGKLKSLVDPDNTSNRTFYFFQRIAYGESAFYSETGKLNSLSSLFIPRVMYLTAGDSHVCPICRPDHMRIFLLTELISPPPRHVWCRCVLIPIYKYLDLIALLMPSIYALLVLYDDDDDDKDKYALLHSYENDEPA